MQEHEEDENDQAHLDSDNEDNPADHEWSLQTQVSIIIIYNLNSLFAHQFNASNKM